ncbi:MAG: hypothetical protein HYU64_15920 [Armatimonadetes bacterium]|nr:hypothetical protein [Armatimonadota bacterium]
MNADILRTLKALDEDLPYLALLTVKGLKPLSRHEKPMPASEFQILQELGLHTAVVERRTDGPGKTHQIIFSYHPFALEIYEQAFRNKPLRISEERAFLEGWMLGYPPCCVRTIIQSPYVPNGLAKEDQKILFHWACPGCSITPYLLPYYREIWDLVARL